MEIVRLPKRPQFILLIPLVALPAALGAQGVTATSGLASPARFHAELMAPLNGERLPDGTLPSARVAVSRAMGQRVELHGGLLRLVSTSRATHALIVGAGTPVRTTHAVLAPFAELTVGRTRSVVDSGGYRYEDETGVGYQPRMRWSSGAVFGGGAGVVARIPLSPWFSLQGSSGLWRAGAAPGGRRLWQGTVGIGAAVDWGGGARTASRSADIPATPGANSSVAPHVARPSSSSYLR